MSLERRVELVRKNGQMVILITSERGMMFEYWDNTPYSLDGKRIPVEERLSKLAGRLLEQGTITQGEYDNLANQLQPAS